MQELTMTPATAALLVLIAAWLVWAVRRLIGRGMCDCHDQGGGKGDSRPSSGCSGSCAGCPCSCSHGK